jgi:hypothetical protein
VVVQRSQQGCRRVVETGWRFRGTRISECSWSRAWLAGTREETGTTPRWGKSLRACALRFRQLILGQVTSFSRVAEITWSGWPAEQHACRMLTTSIEGEGPGERGGRYAAEPERANHGSRRRHCIRMIPFLHAGLSDDHCTGISDANSSTR